MIEAISVAWEGVREDERKEELEVDCEECSVKADSSCLLELDSWFMIELAWNLWADDFGRASLSIGSLEIEMGLIMPLNRTEEGGPVVFSMEREVE